MTKLRYWLTSITLTLAAGFLLVYLLQDQLSAMLVRNTQVTVTQAAVKTNQAKTPQASYDFQAVKPLSLASLSQAAVAKHQVAAVGKLVIPGVKINVPIALGVGNAQLAFAAGTLNADQVMGEGNYALAGHHMIQDETVLFGPLVKSSLGMVAYVTDMTQVYAYQVYARSYIRATQVGVLAPTKQPELTLVTCDDDGTGRLLVQARLVDRFALKQAPAALQKMIEQQ